MIKKTIIILFIVFGVSSSYAQFTFKKIFKNQLHQIPGNIIETSNGDMIFPIITAITSDSLESKIIKIDKEGDVIDSIVISNISNILFSLYKNDENSFFVCGEKNIDNKYYFWLQKYNCNFQLLNEVYMPISGHTNVIYTPIIKNNKNNLVVSFESDSTQSICNINFIEVASNCQIIKYKKFCSDFLTFPNEIIQKDSIYYSFVSGFLNKAFCCIVHKLDSSFNILNVYSLNANLILDGNNSQWLNDSTILLSGKIINNSTHFKEAKIIKIKIDTCLHPLEDTFFAKNDSNNFIGLKKNIDFVNINNFYLGTYETKGMGDYFSNYYSHLVLYKIKSDFNVIWEKEYGGDANYMLFCIKATQDGGCIMAGTRYDYLTQNNETDPFIIKVDSTGYLSWVYNLPNDFIKLTVYPNPGTDKMIINNPPLNTKLVLYDINGQTCISQSLNQSNSINTTSLKSGTYLYRVVDNKGKVINSGKWIKTD